METSNNLISDETKEACAIETMRYMLQEYSQEKNITFEQAVYEFSASSTYQVLFDFNTAVWREGPDYLRVLFEQSMLQK